MSVLLLTALIACSGSDSADVETPTSREVAPPALVSQSWLVEVAAPEATAALTGQPGWQAVYKADYTGAIEAFGGEGPAAARLHAEAAALYRQALLIQSRAIIQTYKEDQRREGDPAEVVYLLGLARLIDGDPAGREQIGLSVNSPVEALAAADRAWVARLEAEGGWFVLSDQPALFAMPEVKPGVAPPLAEAPHYLVPETVGDLEAGFSDPTALLHAAIWHEQAARAAGGDALVDALLAPWRLAPESASREVPAELPLEALFMGPWSSEADLAFVAEVTGSETPAEVLQKHSTTSPYAHVIAACAPEGALNVDCLLDDSSALARQYEQAMATAAGAEAMDHRVFSDFIRAGVLRAAARTATAMGDERTAGVLLLNARDRCINAAADPTFFLALAAWDTGKRNSVRAIQLLHSQVDTLPGLQAARVSLDALHLRVSRDAGPSLPMH
ncbi:MAG: hypothetical protein H6739_40380 [Alphaproteobacteria bacterium]|nr:hypothetical protein [Alphaproteobacteria bacterium]